MPVAAEAVARFRHDCEGLTGGPPDRLGVAVSGGPDSLALLLLAAAAWPGRVHAATVDHGLRAESAGEARFVGDICASLQVPHDTLPLDWSTPAANIQADARTARYRALCGWAADRAIRFAATAHHRDDQAETLLLRLARGSGVAGLAGARRVRTGGQGIAIIRPLLDWPKPDLEAIVTAAGIRAIDDPSNADGRFDRTHARALLAATDRLDPDRLAASASHLADAEAALAWAAATLFEQRQGRDRRGRLTIDAADIPRELQRRLLIHGLGEPASDGVRGPKLIGLLDRLLRGETGTLAGMKVSPGPLWTFEPAPPRRR